MGLILSFLICFTTLIWSGVAQANVISSDSNSIQSISATPIAEGKIAIKIGLKNAVANLPAAFMIDNPPRLIFDFLNTSNKLGKSSQAIDQGELHSINIVQVGTRTRLIVNLDTMLNYDIGTEAHSLLITLQRKAANVATNQSIEQIARYPHPNPLPQAGEGANESLREFHVDGSVIKQFKKESPQQQAENEFRRACVLTQQGRLKEAAIGFEGALAIDPSHSLARESLATVLLQSNLTAKAEKVLQEGIALNPKQTHFAMQLARLQAERNALPLALTTLEKSLPYAKQQADYQAFVAALLQRQNRNTEAIAYYQSALQLSPNSGLWLMGLGMSMQAVQRKEEALEAYQRAIEVRSLTPELHAFVAQRMADVQKK